MATAIEIRRDLKGLSDQSFLELWRQLNAVFSEEIYQFQRKMPYPEFISGYYWAVVRERIFRTKGRKCYRCGKPATDVHHKTYEHHGREHLFLEELEPICPVCHSLLHEDFNDIDDVCQWLGEAKRFV